MKPKKDLVRVVKAPDAKDENGQVLAAGRFEKAFSCQIPSEVYDQMEEELLAHE